MYLATRYNQICPLNETTDRSLGIYITQQSLYIYSVRCQLHIFYGSLKLLKELFIQCRFGYTSGLINRWTRRSPRVFCSDGQFQRSRKKEDRGVVKLKLGVPKNRTTPTHGTSALTNSTIVVIRLSWMKTKR